MAALLCLGCLGFGLEAQAQISLSTVVTLAQKNSSVVKLADADLSKALAELAQAKDVYIPNLVLGSTVGPPSIGFPAGQPSIANATMQSLAFSFPQRQYVAAARAGVEAATLNLKDAREQVALDASTAYVELDAVEHELEAAHRQGESSDRLVRIEQQRSEAGVDPLSDLLQARLTAAQLKLVLLHLESRAGTLASQLSALTGLPVAGIQADSASIPEIPAVRGDIVAAVPTSVQTAHAQAQAKQFTALGDAQETKFLPQIAFGAQYNRDSTVLNNYATYYRSFKADNFSAGFSIQLPLYDLTKKAKARESSADALRATLEAEQAQRQNDVQVATLTGNLRELDAQAEIASLKQQIADEQVKAVESQMNLGNGSGVEAGSAPQISPKSEQLAQIDQTQKTMDALEAKFNLARARLGLLRALGHMDDWLHEINSH